MVIAPVLHTGRQGKFGISRRNSTAQKAGGPRILQEVRDALGQSFDSRRATANCEVLGCNGAKGTELASRTLRIDFVQRPRRPHGTHISSETVACSPRPAEQSHDLSRPLQWLQGARDVGLVNIESS